MNKDILKTYLMLNHWFLDDDNAVTVARILLTLECPIIGMYGIERDGETDSIISLHAISDPFNVIKKEGRLLYEHTHSGYLIEYTTVINIPEDYIIEFRELKIDSLVQ